MRRSRLAIGFLVIVGFAATVAAAAFGLVMLEVLTGPTCRYPKFKTEQNRVRAVVDATQQFVWERNRCPSGTADLVCGRYLDPHTVASVYGGRFVIACRDAREETFIQVRSPGKDGTFDTDDDVVIDSESGGQPR